MKHPSSFSVVIGSIVLAGVFASVASAWTGPTGTAPNNNVAAPINTSASGQVKAGDFATQGKLGVGVVAPSTQLEVAQNTAIKIGQGYISSGGDYLHLANNEWYAGSGSGWIASAAGAMLQLTGQYINFYSHTAAGVHTTEMTVGPTGVNILAPSSGYALRVAAAPGEWAMLVNWPPGTPNSQGILVGTGAGKYSQFQNGEGYYSMIAYSSWGMYTNGNVGAAGFYYLSDKRFKDNIKSLGQGLSSVMKLRPVSFTWNEKDPLGRSGKNDIGFIAQEVEDIYPQAVTTDPTTGYKEVDYPRIVPLLTKSIQDQQALIEKQQSQIDALIVRIEALEAKRR